MTATNKWTVANSWTMVFAFLLLAGITSNGFTANVKIDTQDHASAVNVNGVGIGTTPLTVSLNKGDIVEINNSLNFKLPIQYGNEKELVFTNKDGRWMLQTNGNETIGGFSIIGIDASGVVKLQSLPTTKSTTHYSDYQFVRLRAPITPETIQALGQFNSVGLNIKAARIEDLKNLEALADKLTVLHYDSYTRQDLKPLSKLKSLANLSIHFAPGVENLNALKDVKNLRALNLEYLPDLKSLKGIENCRNLTSLAIYDAGSLSDLSPLAELTSLQQIYLSRCGKVSDLSPLAGLSQLKTVSLIRCSIADLKPLENITGLRELDVPGLNKSVDVTPISKMTNLKRLSAGGSQGISDLNLFSNLKSLETVIINGCRNVKDLSPLKALPELSYLNLFGANGVKDFSPISDLTELTYLRLSACKNIKKIPSLKKLTKLKTLGMPTFLSNEMIKQVCSEAPQLTYISFAFCKNEVDLSPLNNLKNLDKADFSYYCQTWTKLFPTHGLGNLRELILKDCNHLKNYEGIENLKNLRKLDSTLGLKLESIKGLEHAKELRFVNLQECHFSDLSPIANLTKLEWFNMGFVAKLTDLTVFSKLKNLKHLAIMACPGQEDLSPLYGLKKLETLKLPGKTTGKALTALTKELPQITKLSLGHCTALDEISGIKNLPDLEYLYLRNTFKVSDLSPIAEKKFLNFLSISNLGKVTDISPVKDLVGLKSIWMPGCVGVTDISPLKNLKALTALNLAGCKNVKSFKVLKELSSLTSVDLRDCSVPAEELTAIKEALPNCRIQTGSVPKKIKHK